MVVFVVIYVTLYMRQNEAREQAQSIAAELETANRQLSDYAAQVEDLTIANERQRMARELHDTLSQGLAGLILQLEAADAHLTNNRNDKAQSIINNAMKQARVTLADARRAIDDLRQPSLDDLDSALRREIDRFTDATGIPALFHSDPTPPLPAPVTETLIRTLARIPHQHSKSRQSTKRGSKCQDERSKPLAHNPGRWSGFRRVFHPIGSLWDSWRSRSGSAW